MSNQKATVIVFKSYGMGETTNQPLKEKLAGMFLRLLNESGDLPRVICFYTDGVKLVCEGSPVLAELRALEARGVELVICKTCLDTFGLTEQVRVGVIGGMGDILTALWMADKVISL